MPLTFFFFNMQLYLRWKILISIPDVFRLQVGPWRDALREEDKANYHYKWCKLFVCLVPMRPLLSSNKTVLYHVNGPTTVSIIVYEKGLMDTERDVWEFERRKGDCITQWASSWKRVKPRNVTVSPQFRDSKDVQQPEMAGQTSLVVMRIPLLINFRARSCLILQ